MTTRLWVLVDNQAKTALLSEHGLAIYIEHQGKRILFDTGQNEALLENARQLNIKLTGLDAIILSHGHYDHGGNLAYLLENNPSADFYAHPDCLQQRYSLHTDKAPRNISLSQASIAAIQRFPVQQLHWVTQATEIIKGLYLSGEIPRLSSFEDTGGPFFLDKAGHNRDQLNDDMSLWIESRSGLVVVCGCCHSGIVNTLEHINQHYIKNAQALPKLASLIGGLHLLAADKLRLNKTIDYISRCDFQSIYPAHCSGEQALIEFKAHLNCSVIPASAGLALCW